MKKITARNAGLFAGLFFIVVGFPAALATTFGPVGVVDQAENTQYVVRGRVESAGSPHNEPRVGRPYTYWSFRITEQTIGDSLPPEIQVREPGGEVGDFGYHVAGTAEFNAGEDTYVFLRDTDESPQIKEVVGLASGKYRVEVGPNGRQRVVSGLGLPVTGTGGDFSPEDFSALLTRVAKKEATPADRSIFINKHPTHEAGEEKDLQLQAGIKAAKDLLQTRRPAEAEGSTSATETGSKKLAEKPNDSQRNTLTETTMPSEENTTGSSNGGWILVVVLALGLIATLVFFLRK